MTRRDAMTTLAAALGPPLLSAQSSLATRGLFMHAWDLRDNRADSVMGWIADSGLNQIYIAGTYHSGWFVHPANPRHRAYMTEGGVAYFHPDTKLYTRTPLRPQLASFARDTDWLKVAGERLEKYKLRMVSWTIGVHNTRLGQAHPEYTQTNVFGDSIPHALSIGHDAVREYLKALCRDLAVNYPMYGIQLESFGWMGLRHGHHHERDLTGLKPFEQELLTMCFGSQTVAKAQKAGVDAGKAREVVRTTLEGVFREAPDRPAGHPGSMAELEARSPEVKAYNAFCKRLADSMILEIKREALKGTECKVMLQSTYDPALAEAADGFATWAYGEPPQRVLEIVRAAKAEFPGGWRGDFPCFIRLGMGVPSSQGQLGEIVAALKQGGATGPIFYNYSEAPPKMLSWIKPVLAAL